MLTETFVAATTNPDKLTNITAAGIHFHDLQPLPVLRSSFKKSSVKPNCLAIGEAHVFAAQSDKAVVHVYSRERNNLEAVVPFPERIHSIALAGEQDGVGILVLGSEGGKLILWELGTGRQVSTPQHHLQAVTCAAVDLSSNFILSGSTDSNIHVWSLPSLLSFSTVPGEYGQDLPLSPLRSLSDHRTAVTSLAFGHSASKQNIAVSTSRDDTCVVWDYLDCAVLHTFLLQSTPICVALDPVDRAAYVGHEDGSIQLIDFYKQAPTTHIIDHSSRQFAPTQPPRSDQWTMSKNLSSPIHCLQVSYDGTILLSGHQDGKVHAWDVARGNYKQQVADFAAPVTNLAILSPSGFAQVKKPLLKLHHVVKPRYETFANGNHTSGGLSQSYNFTAQLMTTMSHVGGARDTDHFHEALAHAAFPTSVLDKSLVDFVSQGSNANGQDSVALTDLREQNAKLSTQLKEAVATVREHDREYWKRKRDDEIRAARKKRRRVRQIQIDEMKRKKEMGEIVDEGEVEMVEQEEGQDLSSDTDEITDTE
ncbi:MAG: hypothetical protein Q9217_005671 [Psora testacea]